MKSGAGDDPFAEESERADHDDPTGDTDRTADDDRAAETDADRAEDVDRSAGSHDGAVGKRREVADTTGGANETGGTGEADAPDEPSETNEADGPGESGGEETGSTDGTTDDGPRDIDIPWVLRRTSVKDDRPNVTQFFLRDETDAAERRFKNEVEDCLDTDVYTLDLREAAYLVAMRHPDEVAQQLRDWGYDYLD